MKTIRFLACFSIVLMLIMTPVTAEETRILCAIFDNGHYVEHFVSAPSVDTLYKYSKTVTVMVVDLPESNTESDVYSYETRLIRWLYDHQFKCSPQDDENQFDVCLIIPTVMPSFLWIKTKMGDDQFIRRRPSGIIWKTATAKSISERTAKTYSASTLFNILGRLWCLFQPCSNKKGILLRAF